MHKGNISLTEGLVNGNPWIINTLFSTKMYWLHEIGYKSQI